MKKFICSLFLTLAMAVVSHAQTTTTIFTIPAKFCGNWTSYYGCYNGMDLDSNNQKIGTMQISYQPGPNPASTNVGYLDLNTPSQERFTLTSFDGPRDLSKIPFGAKVTVSLSFSNGTDIIGAATFVFHKGGSLRYTTWFVDSGTVQIEYTAPSATLTSPQPQFAAGGEIWYCDFVVPTGTFNAYLGGYQFRGQCESYNTQWGFWSSPSEYWWYGTPWDGPYGLLFSDPRG